MSKINALKPYSKLIDVSSDDRGTFVPFLNQTNCLTDSKLVIKRVYYVYDYKTGVVRGFHFHQREWKYFMVVSGAAKIIALDPEKPKEKFIFISSVRKPNLVVVPPGFANGWISLEEQTVLVCGSTSSQEESIEDDKRIDPFKWGDIWSVKGR